MGASVGVDPSFVHVKGFTSGSTVIKVVVEGDEACERVGKVSSDAVSLPAVSKAAGKDVKVDLPPQISDTFLVPSTGVGKTGDAMNLETLKAELESGKAKEMKFVELARAMADSSGAEPVINGENGQLQFLGADGEPIAKKKGQGAASELAAQKAQEQEAASALGECGHGTKDEMSDRCICETNWGGPKCNENVDCGGHGKRQQDKTCVCEKYWFGDNCDNLECSGHGQVTGGVCRCEPGFTGVKCEMECSGHGHFDEDEGSCICQTGYKGKMCDKFIHPFKVTLAKGNIDVAGALRVAGDVSVNFRAKSPFHIGGEHAHVSSSQSIKLSVPIDPAAGVSLATRKCVRFGGDRDETPCIQTQLITMKMPQHQKTGHTMLPTGISVSNVVSIQAMAITAGADGSKQMHDASNPMSGDSYFQYWLQDSRLSILRNTPKRIFDSSTVRFFIMYTPTEALAALAAERAAEAKETAEESAVPGEGSGTVLKVEVSTAKQSLDTDDFNSSLAESLKVDAARLVLGPVSAKAEDTTVVRIKVKTTAGAESSQAVAQRAQRLALQSQLLVGDYSIRTVSFKLAQEKTADARPQTAVTDADVERAVSQLATDELKLLFSSKGFETDVRKQFAAADRAGIGSVDAKDLIPVLQEMQSDSAKAAAAAGGGDAATSTGGGRDIAIDAKAFVRQFDGDGDGHIEKSEFSNFVKIAMIANAVGKKVVEDVLRGEAMPALEAVNTAAEAAKVQHTGINNSSDDTTMFLEESSELSLDDTRGQKSSSKKESSQRFDRTSADAASSSGSKAADSQINDVSSKADSGSSASDRVQRMKKLLQAVAVPKQMMPANQAPDSAAVVGSLISSKGNVTVENFTAPAPKDFSVDSSITMSDIPWDQMAVSKKKSSTTSLRAALRQDLAQALGVSGAAEQAQIILGKDAIRKSSDGASAEVYFTLASQSQSDALGWKATIAGAKFTFPSVAEIVANDNRGTEDSGNSTSTGKGISRRDVTASVSLDYSWVSKNEAS